MSYEDNTLIRLRRQYSKDETVAALNKKLSEADYKNGELQSELDEVKHLLEESNDFLKLSNKENKKLKKKIDEVSESFEKTSLCKLQKGKIKNYEENFERKKIENEKLHQKITELNSEILTLK
jgi:chromosome segregation ATPase